VRLGATALTRDDAIRTVGQVLIATGCIAPGYIDSMLRREMQANTYLGHGIAIPHGQPQDRELIRRTGIAVVQFPTGVAWREGQTVRLAVGIAARSDEHLSILAALTDLLDDEAEAAHLSSTTNPDEIVAALLRQPSSGTHGEPEVGSDAWTDAVTARVNLPAGVSLHARPAAALVEIADAFAAETRIRHRHKIANARSLAALLKLGAGPGATLHLAARGSDATAALAVLSEAIAAGLGDTLEDTAPQRGVVGWTPPTPLPTITGAPASPGLAIGRIHRYEAPRIVVSTTRSTRLLAEEHAVFTRALETATEQLQVVQDALTTFGNRGQAAIFRAHKALLADAELTGEVTLGIAGGENAAWAWQRAIEARIAEVAQVQDERLAARAADLRDVGQRVLRVLLGSASEELILPDEPVILVADDLAPSDTARFDPKRILGFCTAAGGPTSHTAIIARSLDMPALVGAGPALSAAQNGTTAILDGSTGRLYLAPDAASLTAASTFRSELARQHAAEDQACYQPALLTDGHRVEIAANIGKASEAIAAVEAGAEGVGLLRTEFLFLERTTAPTEDEQFAAYTAMTSALNGLPLIIRTLDIGGDKVLPYLPLPKEDNPFLGVRGVRLCLRQPELFRTQLRAIYRAAATGPVRIMFPMIATLEDLRAARAFAENVRIEVDAPPVEIGIMIEVPSAVLLAPELAREVDFFSIGTNDLTQYALAIDRLHPVLGKQADGLHPAVLRLIDQTVRAADAAGKWVGVCGGIAGDTRGALILTGLGATELSMSLPAIPAVKARLRTVSRTQAQAFAQRALACTTADEVRALPLP
jgi:phosphocarrier protein FPr